MNGSRIERDHLVRKEEGHWRMVTDMGDTVCERVRWDTGSCTGHGCYLGIGDVSTLGGGTALDGNGYSPGIGDGSTLGGGTILGDGTTLGGGVAVGVVDGGASAVLVFQLVKRSRSLDIADSCSWWIVMEASLMVQDRKFRACTSMSSEVTSGWVR